MSATPLPPPVGPVAGATPVTVGGGTYVYVSALEVVLVPPTVVTVMSTVPAEPDGKLSIVS